ncbi:N-acetylglucosaminyl transferase component [Macleaya cordata]|uniref:N-acetylglucosaminyl transferase component n=1 Tax=Macleaya cordata TaxID=56857 RepID=A0A200PRU2_MACCD|nr:N-acetylglucosaminyl transferase component [Macleaya cordata]
MRVKCRIWWPKQNISCENPNSIVLFGWFFRSSSTSLDVVVAVVASQEKISHSHLQPDIEGILHFTNAKMPLSLQGKSTFSVLGHCATDCSFNGQYQWVEMEEKCPTKANGDIYPQNNEESFVENCERWSCGCRKLDRFVEQYRQLSIRNSNWIQLSYDTGYSCEDVRRIPKLHHIHWDGLVVPTFDVHVIIYEPPTFGVHHFSLNSWDSSEQVRMHLKRPMWVDELHQKQPSLDLDTVICAINSATAAKVVFENRVGPQNSFDRFPTVSMLVSVTWHLIAVLVASFFTLLYIILQLCHSFLSYGSQSYIYMIVAKLFGHTWRNIHIRCCQLLYWPIFLRDSGMRYQSSAEYVHRATLRQHSMWSSVAVDIFVGNIVGLALVLHIETACPWVLNLVRDITNDLLRSGCVWLMGVPAGFKLNTELAGIFGMISLNAIQIWSTLWFFLRFLFKYFIKGIAVSGIVLGVTVPAALTIDMIMLATLHVSTLHWLFSVLYSHQIQALTALWRLFRGRKWNPLRERFDSYNYTVKQHVVGSLLFTPLLLLLPTTSVFYIFFTILNTTTNLICIMIEVTVSILHATPYAKIVLWMVRRRRFPSGIWFEIVSGQSTNTLASPKIGFFSNLVSRLRKTERENKGGPRIVVSILRSNTSDIGQIILPHYRDVFRGVSISSSALSAHGVLTGKRIPTSLQTSLPSTMPWLFISFREYWRLCHDSVLACTTDLNCSGKS